MAARFIGNSSGNGDASAGTGIIVVPFVVEWFDQGSLGLAPPFNPKIKTDVKLLGTLRITRFGPSKTLTVPVVLASASLTSTTGFKLACKVTNKAITPTFFLVGLTRLVLFLRESIVFAVFLDVDLVLQTYPLLTREFFALRDGVRPSFPWLIYGPDVTHYSQIKIGTTYQKPVDQPFLIDGDVDLSQDPIMVSIGGNPNWIGMVLQEPVNGVPVTVVRFRAPEQDEVIVRAATCEILRWNGTAWVAYSTLPQRAMDGQLVLQLFDEDGVYDYYAKVLGLLLAEWQYDTDHLRTFIDPQTCPDAFVSLLADNFGLSIVNETPVDEKREFIRQFVILQKEKGVDQSYRDALRVLGYTGYVNTVWVIPGGGPSAYIEKPIGYDNDPPSTYFPASQVSVHLNDIDGEPLVVIDDGVRADVADFLARYILPAHVRIRFFATDVPVRATDESATVSDSLVITQV